MFDVTLSFDLVARAVLVVAAVAWLATMARYSNAERRRLRRAALLATDPWARVAENFRQFGVTIGEQLTPVMRSAAAAMTAFGRAFAALDDALPDADRSAR